MELTYREAEEYINGIVRFGTKNSLYHTRRVLEALGNPDRDVPAIHVAGTNGKGSVCAFLDSVLRVHGMKCAMFTSPHLISMTERFKVDGEEITEAEFLSVFCRVKEAVQALMAEGEPHPSYFEFLYLMAAVWFKEKQVDVAVIEVGLGGRLDATNSLEHPLVCAITSIGYDHMQYLGNTIGEIAGEKAGIIKTGVPVVYDAISEEAARVIAKKAEEMGSASFPVTDKDFELSLVHTSCVDFYAVFRYDKKELFRVFFAAPYQVRNASVALKVLAVLSETYPDRFGSITYEEAYEGLASMRWPARMEEIMPGVFLDGAHNEDGIRELIRSIRLIAKDEPVTLMFSAVSDKDIVHMIRELVDSLKLKDVITTEVGGMRNTSAVFLAEEFKRCGAKRVIAVQEPGKALLEALNRKGDGFLFICGSLYLAGEIEEKIND